MLDHLTSALRQNLHQVVTPQLAAELMAAASCRPVKVDEALTRDGQVFLAGDPCWFDQASEILGAPFSPLSGHHLIVATGRGFQPQAMAVLTRVQHGVRAELTAWVRAERATCADFGRAFLRSTSSYVFDRLQLQVLLALVAPSNVRSLRACSRMGFRSSGFIPNWFGAEGASVLCMQRTTCKWLPKETADA